MRGPRRSPPPFRVARRTDARALAALLGTLVFSPVPAAAQEQALHLPAELEAIRDRLSRYEDLQVAFDDFYVSTLGCIEYGPRREPGRGNYRSSGVAMLMMNGTLFLDGGEVDPERPEVLIYEQLRGGRFRLAGAIWMVPADDAGRPTLFGQRFEGPFFVEGQSRLMPVHFQEYGLYAWLWKDNPGGLFDHTNPLLPCPEDGYGLIGSEL